MAIYGLGFRAICPSCNSGTDEVFPAAFWRTETTPKALRT